MFHQIKEYNISMMLHQISNKLFGMGYTSLFYLVIIESASRLLIARTTPDTVVSHCAKNLVCPW